MRLVTRLWLALGTVFVFLGWGTLWLLGLFQIAGFESLLPLPPGAADSQALWLGLPVWLRLPLVVLWLPTIVLVPRWGGRRIAEFITWLGTRERG